MSAKENPPYQRGVEVQSISDPSRIGTVVEICEKHAGVQWYRVNFGGGSRPKISEPDLRPFIASNKPIDNLINGNIDGYREFQRLITCQRLIRDNPLRNNIYAFNASRTRFFPYQFKPLMKLLDSPKHRLLIADEVGLGKTIEAGLILTELRARQTIQRVLILCPASLTKKWKLELKNRFAEDFQCLNAREFIAFLNEYESSPYDTNLNGIISYESIRRQSVLDQMEALSPQFDVVIADEAHWMRNFGRKQRKAGLLLTEGADAMLLLTATPIHLSNENLFSLLNIMDDEEFPDRYTADERFSENVPIVKTQICMGQVPPNIGEAIALMEDAGRANNIRTNPIYDEVITSLTEIRDSLTEPQKERPLILQTQKELAELNLIGHIFSRTKKREVQSNFPTRQAYPIRLKFTELEREFYKAVTEYVRTIGEEKNYPPGIQQWILNTPQRRMASSIPAMVEHYMTHFGLTEEDLPEDFDQEDEQEAEKTVNPSDFQDARENLKAVLKKWPKNSPDTKYDEFLSILKGIKSQEGILKVMVFAFFKGTLKYLNKRLTEDGFGCDIISGDVSPEERTRIVDKFRNNPSFEILLSSKVGSEGLDFQFSDILFNYDLPWNPMEVEQRIGRLDRIGQQSGVIRIYNFWIEETIEQRILDRLYNRIGIFEKSIGELEMILGDELRTIERDILSKKLTPEEEDRLLEEKARIVDRRIEDLKQLEKESAKFIGTDQFFDSEIEAIKQKRRYVTGEQMHRFIVDFLKANCPRSRLEYDQTDQIGQLLPDEKLRTFLTNNGDTNELIRYLSTQNEGVPITFDAQTAFEKPKIDFINVLHPLTQAVVTQYSQNEELQSNAHYVLLDTKKLNEGLYLYFIYKLRINAARGGNTLETIILNEALEAPCTSDEAEEILGEMIEKGEEPKNAVFQTNQELMEAASRKANELFLAREESIRLTTQRNNDLFVARRLESLRTSYHKKINVKKNQLEKAINNKRQERYIKMLSGTIRRLEAELDEKSRNLDNLRNVQVEYDEVAAGILEVNNPQKTGIRKNKPGTSN